MVSAFVGGERKIVLWVPDWSVASLAASVPPGSPAATVKNGSIYECTRNARVFGVRQGMKRTTAQHICPDLLTLPHDPIREASAFDALLQSFDQVVTGVNAVRPGLAWAPLPRGPWAQNEKDLAYSLAEEIALETGIEAFIGIGDGVASAFGAARRGIIVPAAETAAFIEELALPELVEFLPREARTAYQEAFRVLHLLGIRMVKDLWELGSTQLITRLGQVGESIWTLSTGGDFFIPSTADLPQEVSSTYLFDPPAIMVEHSLVGVRIAAQELVDRLAAADFAAQTLTIQLHFSDGNMTERRWSLFDMSQSAPIAQRTIWQIQSWQDQRSHKSDKENCLETVILKAGDLLCGGKAGLLWGERINLTQVGQTVAEVQALLGDESVRQPQLQGGMAPRERAALHVWGSTEDLSPREGEWAGSVQESPLLLFDHPPLAKVMGRQRDSTWGQLVVDRRGLLSGVPTRVAVLQERAELPAGGYNVEGVEGLWAVKSNWWVQEGSRSTGRSYLRLRIQENVDFLLVQKAGEWTVEGLYVQYPVPPA